MRILLPTMIVLLACGSGPLWAAPPSAKSPDGKRVATASGKALVVAENQKVVMKILAHKSDITALAFSPDGKLIASADKDEKLNLIDAGTGKLVLSLAAVAGADKLSFSADGRTVEVKSPAATKKYDVKTGVEK